MEQKFQFVLISYGVQLNFSTVNSFIAIMGLARYSAVSLKAIWNQFNEHQLRLLHKEHDIAKLHHVHKAFKAGKAVADRRIRHGVDFQPRF